MTMHAHDHPHYHPSEMAADGYFRARRWHEHPHRHPYLAADYATNERRQRTHAESPDTHKHDAAANARNVTPGRCQP